MEMPVTPEDMWTAKCPWNAVDSVETATVRVVIHERDTIENIQKCLTCTEIQCWNCLAPKNQRERRKVKKTWKPT